jgi:hypothetical protein
MFLQVLVPFRFNERESMFLSAPLCHESVTQKVHLGCASSSKGLKYGAFFVAKAFKKFASQLDEFYVTTCRVPVFLVNKFPVAFIFTDTTSGVANVYQLFLNMPTCNTCTVQSLSVHHT